MRVDVGGQNKQAAIFLNMFHALPFKIMFSTKKIHKTRDSLRFLVVWIRISRKNDSSRASDISPPLPFFPFTNFIPKPMDEMVLAFRIL